MLEEARIYGNCTPVRSIVGLMHRGFRPGPEFRVLVLTHATSSVDIIMGRGALTDLDLLLKLYEDPTQYRDAVRLVEQDGSDRCSGQIDRDMIGTFYSLVYRDLRVHDWVEKLIECGGQRIDVDVLFEFAWWGTHSDDVIAAITAVLEMGATPKIPPSPNILPELHDADLEKDKLDVLARYQS